MNIGQPLAFNRRSKRVHCRCRVDPRQLDQRRLRHFGQVTRHAPTTSSGYLATGCPAPGPHAPAAAPLLDTSPTRQAGIATSPPGGPRLEPLGRPAATHYPPPRSHERRMRTRDGHTTWARPSNVVTSLGVPDDLIGEIGQRIRPLRDQIVSA
jgi:hypothetical protein